MASPNSFFIQRKGQPCYRLDIHATSTDGASLGLPFDCQYFGAALREVDKRLEGAGLRFYMLWDLEHAPALGDDVVVLMIGDERYQVPRYAGRVLAIFKTGALTPFRPYAGRRAPALLHGLDALRTLRDAAVRWRRAIPRALLARAVYAIPLGYHQQVQVAERAFDERSTDVFFAGERAPALRWTSPPTWPLRPRTAARHAMFSALDELARRVPRAVCDFTAVSTVRGSLEPLAYSQRLMNAKIALCPRGNFPETFRFLEAARAGCAILSEPLPDVWYFANHPAWIVSDWRKAPALIEYLLANPTQLRELHERSRIWWRDVACEGAVGRYIAEQLTKHLAERGTARPIEPSGSSSRVLQ